MINPIVVVAKLRKLALSLVIRNKPAVTPYEPNFGVTNRGEAIGDHRHPGNAKSHRSQRRVIMKRHLESFIRIFVMHVVNDVHGVDINACQPLHHSLELIDNVVEVQIVSLNRPSRWSNLLSGYLVSAAVDRIEEALDEVGSRTEELHLLPHNHRRHTTGNRSIITQRTPHNLIVFKLNRTRVDRHFRGEASK